MNNIAFMPFVPSWDMSEPNKRLMLLSAHLETADDRHRDVGEQLYDQSRLTHDCGTPACASGHGAALFDFDNGDCWEGDFFDLNGLETGTIFGTIGCGRARNAKQAAAYIRDFTLRRHFAAKAAA